MSHLPTRGQVFTGAGRVHLNCPRCGLTITPKARPLTAERCPRCLARNGIAVGLFASTLPADALYASGAAPDAGRLDAPQPATEPRA